MPRKCPPGVVCFSNGMLYSIILITIVLGFGLYNMTQQNGNNSVVVIRDRNEESSETSNNDILSNPYVPPLKNTNILFNIPTQRRGVPINIKTRSFDSNYSQVGILTRDNGDEKILPLMGRPLYSNRSKWQFYTMSDSNNSVKLPVNTKGKNCTGEYGCDEIMNGDTIFVDGYNDAFKVKLYENEQHRYIPYL